jgi:PIN domain nuclease of toxin-antitoxin system
MNYLLDTHTLIWFLNGDKLLSSKAKSIIENSKHNKFVSIASFWEIAIKLGLEKLEFDGDIAEIIELAENNNFEILPISVKHTIEYKGLEFIHRDPFDRMLVIQAIVEDFTILTKDEYISKYKVKSDW